MHVIGSIATPPLQLPLIFLAVVVSVMTTTSDIRSRTISNSVIIIGACFAILLGISFDPSGQFDRVLAAFLIGGMFTVVSFCSPDGLGMGDAKLVWFFGLCFGWFTLLIVLIALLFALCAGTCFAICSSQPSLRKTTLPFAPYLAVGSFLSLSLALI